MIRRALALGLLLACGAGCGAEARVEVEPATPATVSRFAGTWLVEETVPHATYFATLYRFHPDGTLELVENYSYDQSESYPRVGWGGNAYLVCGFGDRWSATDDRLLVVDGDCSDGTARPIRIAFEPDLGANAEGVGVRLESVGGEAELWEPPVWGWQFIRCQPDRSNCDRAGF